MTPREPLRLRPETWAGATVVLCFLLNLLGRGVGESYTVFLLPLGAEFGWDRSSLTSIYAVYMMVHGLSGPVVGALFDRWGPRVTYGAGLLALGSGNFLAGNLDRLWQFYLCVGVLAGFGVSSMTMVTASGLISRWYRARLTTAMGVVFGGLGLGVLVVVPAVQYAIQHSGWRTAYHLIGGALVLFAPILLILPWRRIAAGHPDFAEERRRKAAHGGGRILLRAIGTGAFWGLFLAFFFTSAAMFSITVQAVAYFVEIGFTPLEAAGAFGLTGSLATAGLIITSFFADRYGRRLTVTISYLMTLLGILLLFLLSLHPAYWLLLGFIAIFGITLGARGPVISTLAAEIFAGGGQGAIYGTITMGLGLGAGFGSWVSGTLYDLTGGYETGFAFAALSICCAVAQFWLVPALGRDRSRA